MQQVSGSWLAQELKTNGMTAEDLENATGITEGPVMDILAHDTAPKDVWDAVLGWLNDLPALNYPDPSILDQIRACIQNAGPDGECLVYYGVNAKDLIFTGLQDLATMESYGANTETEGLAQLQLTLAEALQLFTKQNCTL